MTNLFSDNTKEKRGYASLKVCGNENRRRDDAISDVNLVWKIETLDCLSCSQSSFSNGGSFCALGEVSHITHRYSELSPEA